jgi:flavin reductase (DIM6/NTAB) family NADH-FMN oxidoreductase RutF
VAFDCRLTHCELFGTHHVMFGEVEDIFIAQQGLPLIYANRAYGTPSRLEPPALGPRKRISTF